MPYRSQAAAVLEEWRAVERRHAEETPDTPEWESTERELMRLRDAYLVTVDEALAAGAPQPPPFPSREAHTDSTTRDSG